MRNQLLIAAIAVILILSLSFSSPAQTLAQIRAEAARDAKKDVKEVLWFSAGGGICVLGGIETCLGILGTLSSSTGGFFGYAPSVSTKGTQSGFSESLFSKISDYNPAPPPKRLLGKPPDYVQHYTRAYQKKARHHRVKWAAIGAGSCGILTISSTLIYIRLQD
jgi:hypothetical protein